MMASDRNQNVFERVYDKGTIQWILGILIALWLAASGFLYAEIAAVRDDVSRIDKAVVRIETLLQERLPPAE